LWKNCIEDLFRCESKEKANRGSVNDTKPVEERVLQGGGNGSTEKVFGVDGQEIEALDWVNWEKRRRAGTETRARYIEESLTSKAGSGKKQDQSKTGRASEKKRTPSLRGVRQEKKKGKGAKSVSAQTTRTDAGLQKGGTPYRGKKKGGKKGILLSRGQVEGGGWKNHGESIRYKHQRNRAVAS